MFLLLFSVQHQHCLVVRDVYGTQTMSLHFYAVSGTSNRKVKQRKAPIVSSYVKSMIYVGAPAAAGSKFF
jgi:uncharacterized protein YcgI (DUF1989 family)